MPKINFEPFLKKTKQIFKNAGDVFEKAFATAKKIKWHKIKDFAVILLQKMKSSWKLIAVIIPAFIVLYYPLGGYLMENIDTDTTKDIKVTSAEQSNLVNAMAFLVDKEINQNIWTPNLPFFFPSYFLDNMPSFQLGEIDAVSKTAKTFASLVKKYSNTEDENLQKAAEYLSYPATVWMFAPNSDSIFAPSSATQYRKGKHELMVYNQNLADRKTIFSRGADDLEILLSSADKNISASIAELQNHIRENQDAWTDGRADNLFYYTKGKLYAYYILLKAAGDDYKSIIINADMYAKWSEMLSCLERAAELSPLLVRNANMKSSLAPNHLAYMQMYALCATNSIKDIEFSTAEEL